MESQFQTSQDLFRRHFVAKRWLIVNSYCGRQPLKKSCCRSAHNLGADLIYDPPVVPHLVRVLAIMLWGKSPSRQGLSDARDFDEGIIRNRRMMELRNLTTLHLFFKLAENAGLEVTDVTEPFMPKRILPEIYHWDMWDRSQTILYKVVSTRI